MEAVFSGHVITSDGGGMLLWAADTMLGLTQKAVRSVIDFRRDIPSGVVAYWNDSQATIKIAA